MDKKTNILLIEDNPGDVRLIQEVLSEMDHGSFVLTSEESLAKGRERLAEYGFDIVLLDLHLPDSQGMETLDRILECTNNMPVVVMTGLADENLARMAINRGAQDYVIKGNIEKLRLQSIVFHAIERQNLLSKLEVTQEERFRTVIEKNADSMLVLDQDGMILFTNPSAERLFGRNFSDLIRTQFGFPTPLGENTEIEIISGEGRTITAEMRTVGIQWDKQQAFLVSIRDITDRKQAQKARILEQIAFVDMLTGLPNRRNFIKLLDEALSKTKRDQSYIFSVLFMDLDEFKEINDRLGHEAGDALIVEMGKRIKASVRPNDVVARLAGDEFIILLDDIQNTQFATLAAERILTAVATPFILQEAQVFVKASIGIVLEGGPYANVEAILYDADLAMYSAKSKGKGRYEIFEHPMREKVIRYSHIRTEIARAVQENQCRLYYQPILDVKNTKVSAVEALIRWQHPDMGLLLPDSFIEIAEKSGFIDEISQWVFRESVTQSIRWRDAGHSIRVSVNLSYVLFQQKKFEVFVHELLGKSRSLAEGFDLEISERFTEEDVEAARIPLHALSDLGCQISLDDFGMRSASLSCLMKLPVKFLKIDRSFVKNLHQNQKVKTLVKNLIYMAHDMNIRVIAEGVETGEQFRILEGLACDEVQGFLFSQAVPGDTVLELIAKSPEHWRQLTRSE